MNLRENILRIKQVMGLNESFLDWFKSPKNIDTEEERFTCADCGTQDYSMYMVNDDIWKKYGNEKFTLCKSCLEKRIGRKLTKKDISQYKDTLVNIHNPEMRGLNESSFLRRRVDITLMDIEFADYLNYMSDNFLSRLNDGMEVNFNDFKIVFEKDQITLVSSKVSTDINFNSLILVDLSNVLDSSCSIENHIDVKHWAFKIRDDVKVGLKQKILDVTLEFYICKYQNKNFVFRTIPITLERLVREDRVFIPHEFNIESDSTEVSIVTKKFFDTYSLRTLNESKV